MNQSPDLSTERRVVIVSRVKQNPYVALLCEGLRRPDLHIHPQISDTFSLTWMWRHRRQIDALHIHWLELLFVYPILRQSLKRWASVMAGLLVARLSGVRLVYTVHNIAQHEGRRARLVWLGHRVMFWLAQAVHVHDHETAQTLAAQWGRRRGVHIIPHGNYMTAYRNDCSRAEARQRLEVDERAFVFLFLGRVRPYKGVEDLIAAFRTLPDADAILWVAGEIHEPGYERELRALTSDDARIHLDLRFVADDELQVYLHAADFCVLPYRHVTTSGAAILSFSFGTPIIAPRKGCFVALVGEGQQRGLLYDETTLSGGSGNLTETLRRARSSDLAAMRTACVEYAQTLDWNRIARQHAAMYQP